MAGLLIFIKNPEKGKVKTRLAGTVGDDRALKIYQSLLAHTRNIALSVAAERFLFYSSFVDKNDDWQAADFTKAMQSTGDLGDRMEKAFAAVLARHDKAVDPRQLQRRPKEHYGECIIDLFWNEGQSCKQHN